MGDSYKRKDYGIVACISRATTAACVYWMGYGDESLIWIFIMVINVIGILISAGVRRDKDKQMKVTVNG